VKSSNPVLAQLAGRSQQHASFRPGPGAGYPTAPSYQGYAGTSADRMTIDDVVVRAVTLLAVVGAAGALAWSLLADSKYAGGYLLGAAIGGLALGMIISFARVTNPVVLLTYAAIEGVFVGLASAFYDARYHGIVVQAAASTFAIFIGMAVLYKFKVLRATPTFVKWVTGAIIGCFALMLVNFGLSFFVSGGIGIRSGGPLAIIFSLVCIGVAALSFILDFAAIEEGVRAGIDRKFAWYAAFGIIVGLIWLYLEILRLLGYARR
jgi:uncharacterized YccA/Bax inhibitor family protein